MEQAQEFVRERVDLIVAFEDKSIAAAQDATADPANRIPVVFLHPSDPVRDGLVDSLAASGREPDRGVGRARSCRQAARDLPADPARTAALAPAHARRSDRHRDAASPPQGAGCRRQARDRAGRTAGIRRRRSRGRLPIGRAGRGRRCVHPVAQPAARLLQEDPRAGGGSEPSRPGPSARNGSTRSRSTTARSSRLASTSGPSGPQAPVSSTAS